MSDTAQSTTSRPEVDSIRPGEELDLAAVGGFLRAELGIDGPVSAMQFPKGSANLTYLLEAGDQTLVLRRPPFGRVAPGAHDMGREYKALSRLWRAYPPAPRALAFCDDEGVIGARFFIMEYRPGVVIWDALPDSMAGQPDCGRRVGFAVVDALADLHQVDPYAWDLGGLGRPDGFVARQVDGWRARWAAVRPPGGLPAMDEAGDLLEATRPAPQRVSVLHNDLKVDNCQFAPTDPDRVRSVFDWDMATLGDPLVDFGILLNYWPDPSDRPGDRGVYADGMASIGLPTKAEITAHYGKRTGLDVSGATWYEAFACWKTVVVLQQLYDRYLRGETTDVRMAAKGERVPELAARALRLVRSVAV